MILTKNDILVVQQDFIIPGTGLTFYFYKGEKYKVIGKNKYGMWNIKPIKIRGMNGGFYTEWLTYNQILENFFNIKKERKEKLNEIESRNII